jgi:hypothetical protein
MVQHLCRCLRFNRRNTLKQDYVLGACMYSTTCPALVVVVSLPYSVCNWQGFILWYVQCSMYWLAACRTGHNDGERRMYSSTLLFLSFSFSLMFLFDICIAACKNKYFLSTEFFCSVICPSPLFTLTYCTSDPGAGRLSYLPQSHKSTCNFTWFSREV